MHTRQAFWAQMECKWLDDIQGSSVPCLLSPPASACLLCCHSPWAHHAAYLQPCWHRACDAHHPCSSCACLDLCTLWIHPCCDPLHCCQGSALHLNCLWHQIGHLAWHHAAHGDLRSLPDAQSLDADFWNQAESHDVRGPDGWWVLTHLGAD